LTAILAHPHQIEVVTVKRFANVQVPSFGSYRYGWLDLVYHQDPGLQAGQSFPLWAIE